MVYHADRKHTWMNTRWQGHEIQKYPTDMWVYQEILHETGWKDHRMRDLQGRLGPLFRADVRADG